MTDATVPIRPRQPSFFTSLVNFFDEMMNFFLAMRMGPATLRFFVLAAGNLVIWLAVAIKHHPWPTWLPDAMQLVVPAQNVNPAFVLLDLVGQIGSRMFQADVLASMLTLWIPFIFAFLSAALYVSSIYHESLGVGIRFVSQAAFALPGYKTIHIEDGRMREEDLQSPVARIGGPGFAIVNLENAALFERIGGRLLVVPPTLPGVPRVVTLLRWLRMNRLADFLQNLLLRPGFFVMEGFDRYHRAISLRDQVLNLGENAPIKTRTLDGIPVSVGNVALLFSITRLNNPSTLQAPYPFAHNALLRLVLNQPLKVWHIAIINLVRNDLLLFTARFPLNQILANFGQPEVGRDTDLRSSVANLAQRMGVLYAQPLPQPRRVQQPPGLNASPFIPRVDLTNQFLLDFVAQFPTRARQSGVNLEWIDVGAWDSQVKEIFTHHRQAYELAIENQQQNGTLALTLLRRKTRLEESIHLNRQLPILAFARFLAQAGNDPDTVIWNMILEYHQVLQEASDRLKESHRPIPDRLKNALENIQQYQLSYMRTHGKGRILGP